MNNTLYTVGHSTHTVEHFIELLKMNSINAICDVRSQPYSQYNSQFNREDIKVILEKNGISYVFLGKELGARSDNPECYINGKVQYNYITDEPGFIHGINRVKQGMNKFNIALMCAEKDPITCHRMILVCKEMKDITENITHILSDGSTESNEEAEKRLMSSLKITPDMFRGVNECTEDAYNKQASKIAYVEELDNNENNGQIK